MRVARRVRELTNGDTYLTLWALLHDASEAYLNDVSRPVKHQDALAGYRDAERILQRAVCERFDLDPIEPAVVRQADNELLWAEAPRLFKGGLHPDLDAWTIRDPARRAARVVTAHR